MLKAYRSSQYFLINVIINIKTTATKISLSAVTLHTGAAMLCCQRSWLSLAWGLPAPMGQQSWLSADNYKIYLFSVSKREIGEKCLYLVI